MRRCIEFEESTNGTPTTYTSDQFAELIKKVIGKDRVVSYHPRWKSHRFYIVIARTDHIELLRFFPLYGAWGHAPVETFDNVESMADWLMCNYLS